MVGGHDRDERVVAVPVRLPHSEVGWTRLRDIARSKVDQEEASPSIPWSSHHRIG